MSVDLLLDCPTSRVLVIAALIVLMALLFGSLFIGQQRIGQSACFAHIQGHIVPIDENWRQGSCANEILLESSDRGLEWTAQPPVRGPTPPAWPSWPPNSARTGSRACAKSSDRGRLLRPPTSAGTGDRKRG